MLAGVKRRGDRESRLFQFGSVKLGETAPDRLATRYGLGRELDGLIAIRCLNGNRLAGSYGNQKRLE